MIDELGPMKALRISLKWDVLGISQVSHLLHHFQALPS
jgi:hypothetical protein